MLLQIRCIAAHGLEPRTPYLDRHFMATYLSVPTNLRRPVPPTIVNGDVISKGRAEKQLLREAFDPAFGGPPDPLLPQEVTSRYKGMPMLTSRYVLQVLWRRKEAFSDGVSSTERPWFAVIASHVEPLFPGDAWQAQAAAFASAGDGPAPYTRESLWYRRLFHDRFQRLPPQYCLTLDGSKCEVNDRADAAGVVPYYWMPRWCGSAATDPSARTLQASVKLLVGRPCQTPVPSIFAGV
jgi:asparagine synthase (glutamine-hydrolysing)